MARLRRRSARPRARTRPPAAAAMRSAKVSSTRVRPTRSTAVRLEPTDLRTVEMSVTVADGPSEFLDSSRDRGLLCPAGVDEEGADRVAAGLLGDVGGVGDEEAVLRCGRELRHDADVVERHRDALLGAAIDQAQVDRVAGVELVVLHGLGGDEDGVGLRGQGRHQPGGGAAAEVAVLQGRRMPDRRRVAPRRGLAGRCRCRRSGAAAVRRPDTPDTERSCAARAGVTTAPGGWVTVTSAPLVSWASASAWWR